MITKDMKAYLKRLRQQGYRLVPTPGQHYKIYRDETLVATAGGGGNWHSLRNLQGEIRRFEQGR